MKTLSRGAIVIAFSLSLAACGAGQLVSTIEGATVTQKVAGAAVAAFDVAEGAANGYLALPSCRAGQTTLTSACKTQALADTLNGALDKADPVADALLADIQAAHKAGKGVGVARAAYDAVIAATSDIKSKTPATE